MMGFSLGHLIVLLVIILLFGGRRLPELGAALGKGLRHFKHGLEGVEDKKVLEKTVKSTKEEDSGSSGPSHS